MSKTSGDTVGALLVNEAGQVLFGFRAAWKVAWPNRWDVIGGHVEAGENLEQALIREVQEEVGVTPTAFEWIETLSDIGDQQTCHFFAVTAWAGGEPSNVCDEHTEIRWHAVEELAAMTNLAGEGYPRLAQMAVDRRRAAS